jgi:hypothetical protein
LIAPQNSAWRQAKKAHRGRKPRSEKNDQIIRPGDTERGTTGPSCCIE